MLAPPTDFGYSPTHAGFQAAQAMPVHSHERPTLYAVEPQAMHMGMMEYTAMMHPHAMTPHAMTPHAAMTPSHAMTPVHAMTPQHHQPVEYDHEPIMMATHTPTGQYYAPMEAQMLLVSSDYGYQSSTSSVDGATPKNSKVGSKRSREDLNLKEKKRMFKLNDRINQLKDMLDEAGVQTKKNKQSILDNAAFFIEQLRSDLAIAKQKAARAEKEAQQLKSLAKKQTANVYTGCFQKSATPRAVVDLNLKPIALNSAFISHTGHNDEFLQKKENLSSCLCTDAATLETIVKKVREESKPTSMMVQTQTAQGTRSALLMASAVADDEGKPSHIEFSLVPVETETEAKVEAVEAAKPAVDAEDAKIVVL